MRERTLIDRNARPPGRRPAPVFLTGFVPVLAILACGHEKIERAARHPIDVTTLTVSQIEEPRRIDAVGSLRCVREAVLSSKVMGTVTEIRKTAGETFRRGEVLLAIDARDVAGQIDQAQGALAQAKAAAALAEANFKRFEQLFSRGAASQLELDQARFQHETARGAVLQAEGAVQAASSYQRYAEIPAPFDGRVVDRLCEVGDMAAPGRPLLKIEDPSRLRMEAALPENAVSVATIGATVRVVIPSLGDREVEGRIAEIVPSVDPETRSTTLKIDLHSDPDLRSGLFARAILQGGLYKSIRIPRAGILERGGMTGAFVAENGRATFRLLTLAGGFGDPVEILAGLTVGERVIVSSPAMLEEGSPVEVRE